MRQPVSPSAVLWRICLFGCLVALAGLLALWGAGVPFNPIRSTLFNLFLFFGAWLPLVAILAGVAVFRERPPSPFAYLRTQFFTRAYLLRQLRMIPILVTLALFMNVFSAMKSAIPLFNPFSWDEAFIRWDYLLGFGNDPWQLIQPLVGYPIVSSALSGLYHLWILLIYAGSVYMAAHQPDEALRLRYFVSYFLCWSVIGVVLAIGFSSVGPVFMEPLFGNDRFEPLMDYLRAADGEYPIFVLPVQQQLLDWHATGDFGLGRGISAMPSMHISLAVLFWLAMRRLSDAAGWLFGGYAWIIFIASIHTAYHYAVDGIVAAAVTWLIWWLVGRIFSAQADTPPS